MKTSKLKTRSTCLQQSWAALIGAVVLLGSVLSPIDAQAINGGEEADQPYEFMASIQTLDGQQRCGGSLIADRWILSAKHCFFEADGSPYDWSNLVARIGSNNRTIGGDVRQILTVRTVDDDTTPSNNDLALVELDAPTTMQPIPLAPHNPGAGDDVRMLGWGDHLLPENPGDPWPDPPTMLRQLDQKVVDPLLCDAPDPIGYIEPGEVCVGITPKGESQRAGDSGGPLLIRGQNGYVVAGVVSRAGWLFTPGRDVHGIFGGIGTFHEWIRNTIAT